MDVFPFIVYTIGLYIGFFLLNQGSDKLIEAAEIISLKTGLSIKFIATIFVAFGTSTPELFSTSIAVVQGHFDLGIYNIIGSNIQNVFVILIPVALIFRISLSKQIKAAKVDIFIMTFVVVLLYFLFNFDIPNLKWETGIDLYDGVILFAIFLWYVYFLYKSDSAQDDIEELTEEFEKLKATSLLRTISIFIISLFLTLIGAKIVVYVAILIASTLGIGESIIGMTIVAFGTSLPELFVSISAAKSNQAEMMVGNIVGSNILNIILVVGVAGILSVFAP